MLAYIDIDIQYKSRALKNNDEKSSRSIESSIIETIIFAVTCMAIITGYIKEWFAMEWYTFRDPIIFHKAETQQLIREGFAPAAQVNSSNY